MTTDQASAHLEVCAGVAGQRRRQGHLSIDLAACRGARDRMSEKTLGNMAVTVLDPTDTATRAMTTLPVMEEGTNARARFS